MLRMLLSFKSLTSLLLNVIRIQWLLWLWRLEFLKNCLFTSYSIRSKYRESKWTSKLIFRRIWFKLSLATSNYISKGKRWNFTKNCSIFIKIQYSSSNSRIDMECAFEIAYKNCERWINNLEWNHSIYFI